VGGDHQVDNRLLAAALLAAVEGAGGRLVRRRGVRVETEADRVTGVELDDGTSVAAEQVVLAAGCWSRQVEGLPPDALPPVRPVKGQILRLHGPEVLRANLRGLVRGRSLYLVPRPSGEIVVGATVEEQGFDTRVTVEGVHHLLHDAAVLVPDLLDLELAEVGAGLRPGTPDNAPIVGPGPVEGLVVATGHYRNGILLTPVTADGVAGLLDAGPPVPELAAFGLDRFSGARVA
jgi:glycine oxidase